MKKFGILSIIISLILITGPLTPARADQRLKVDPAIAQVAELSICNSSSESDCIETVRIQNISTGKFYASIFKSQAIKTEVDSSKQSIQSGNTEWEYDSGSGKKSIILDVKLTTPSYEIIEDVAPVDADAVIEETPTVSTLAKEPKLEVDQVISAATKLANNEILEISIRLSWLNPIQILATARSVESNFTPIPQGNRLILSGGAVDLISYYKTVVNNVIRTQGVNVITELQFIALHPNSFTEDNLLKPTCANLGYLLEFSNSMSVTLPTINDDSSSMDFFLSNYPFSGFPPGQSGNLGTVYMRVPMVLLDCWFPENEFTDGSNFSTIISNTEPTWSNRAISSLELVKQSTVNLFASVTPKVSSLLNSGIYSLSIENFYLGKLRVTISSNGTLTASSRKAAADKAAADKAAADKAAADKAAADKAAADKAAADKAAADKATADKAAADKATADKAVVIKKTTITCVKGKDTKKVTAINPKCPSGYKKK